MHAELSDDNARASLPNQQLASMLTSGRYYEEIVSMLTSYASEVKMCSALGLTNINKHSENFIMRLLNAAYGYELINLNYSKQNYPGLDLGDAAEGVAFQITATKSSDKVDETLATCLKYEHYKTFKTINVFVLTKKQSSYMLKTVTKPHFSFTPQANILDVEDLLRRIGSLGNSSLMHLHEYIKQEVKGIIEDIRTNKGVEEKSLLDVDDAMLKTGTTNNFLWRTKLHLKSAAITAPAIYNQLNTWLFNLTARSFYLPYFNDFIRVSESNKHVQYHLPIENTNVRGYFYGHAILMEPSCIQMEDAHYTSETILLNLRQEMISLLTTILFFRKIAKGAFQLEVTITMKANRVANFLAKNSIVAMRTLHGYQLDSPYIITKTITDIQTETLRDLLQEIMYGFTNNHKLHTIPDPFIAIQKELADLMINEMKEALKVNVEA